MDARANKGRVTLLHFTVEEVVRQDEHVLDFVESLNPVLTTISRYTQLHVLFSGTIPDAGLCVNLCFDSRIVYNILTPQF